MPAERLAMRRVREILRYRFEDSLGHKAISYRVGAAPSTVRETLRRAEAAGLTWPLGEEITDAVLEAALYRAAGTKTGHRRSVEPDWAEVHRELKRKHVTLQILWDEYIERHPDGYRYSRFCDLYRGWAANLPVTMRQNHAAGDKLFVDYAGDMVGVIIDRSKGKTRQAHLFVAVLGASSLSYAEARWSETLPDWIGCHVNALETYPGGAVYGGTKWFVRDFMEVLRMEAGLEGTNIRTATVYPAAINTELLDTISDEELAGQMHGLYDKYGIAPDRIADVVAFAIDAPEDTTINEFTVGPTGQPW